MSDDILDLIDGALADYTSADAMRWSPEPEKAETDAVDRAIHGNRSQPNGPRGILSGWAVPEPQREPVTDMDRPGHEIVLFVGGPWHCDLRAMRTPLPIGWNVLPNEPVAWWLEPEMVSLPEPIHYRLERGTFLGVPAAIYRTGTDREEMEQAAASAWHRGWLRDQR